MGNPLEETSQNKENAREHDPLHERARAIADGGDFFEALRLLREEGHLEREMMRVKNMAEFASLKKESWMSDREWELFTVIELYDPNTARHSVHTFLLLKEKIAATLEGPDGSKLRLLDIITHDEKTIARETLLRAALFHDIGKIKLPRFLIASQETNVRQPLKHIFNTPQQQEILEARGFNLEAPAFDAFKTHEEESGKILANQGFHEEAELARFHHNYAHKNQAHPNAHDAIHLGATESGLLLGDIIHLADVEDALKNQRTYKGEMPFLSALFFLVKDALEKKVNPMLTYLWVKSELPQLGKEGAVFVSEKENREKKYIDDFLSSFEEAYQTPVQEAA